MISLIVTTDGDTNYDLADRDADFGRVMEQFAEPYEIIYTICSDYAFKDELSRIVCSQKNRHLIISAPSTNINTQIYSAMDVSDNGDVLLCTIDTNPDVMMEILNKHYDGADLVFVRHKENWFKSIFTSLGKATYQLGLKILGHGQDMCCDARVIYLNARSINTIIMNPTLSKALRLVSADPDKTLRVIRAEKVYGNPTYEQKEINKSIFSLGIVSMVYLLALLAMAIIFPLYNGGIYTGWLLLGLIVWVLLGILGCVMMSRVIYRARLGYPVAVDLQNEPVLNIEDYISYNYELAKQFYDDENYAPTSSLNMLKQKAAEFTQDEEIAAPKSRTKTTKSKAAEKSKASAKEEKTISKEQKEPKEKTSKKTAAKAEAPKKTEESKQEDKNAEADKKATKKAKEKEKTAKTQKAEEKSTEATKETTKNEKEPKEKPTKAKEKATKKPEVSKVSGKSKSKIKK